MVERSDLYQQIRSVADFPKPGILFRDITTLLKDPDSVRRVVDIFAAEHAKKGVQKVAAIESRGFIFGALIAQKLGAGFIPIRKPGKLPASVLKEEYVLEYGTDTLEIHEDSVLSGENVLLHDDLLATGGTARAACQLVKRLGGNIVEMSFLIELTFLKGRDQLEGYDVFSILKYDED